MNNAITPFKDNAPIIFKAGLEPRPVKDKACYIKGWQRPLTEFPPNQIDQWIEKFPAHGIGLVMGSAFPDGTLLGGLDIDHDDYKDLGVALLNNPISGRVGSKGAVLFFRYKPTLKLSKKIKVISKEYASKYDKPVAEWLMAGSLCVIPPSIHRDTKQPYHWLGKPLHEINFEQLPLIGE